MFRRSKANKKRAWKMERASVGGGSRGRARSNKFSRGDADKRPRAHSRKGNWVGGYTKRDGTKVKGYYRTSAQYRWL
jgi:hypothetical protein